MSPPDTKTLINFLVLSSKILASSDNLPLAQIETTKQSVTILSGDPPFTEYLIFCLTSVLSYELFRRHLKVIILNLFQPLSNSGKNRS